MKFWKLFLGGVLIFNVIFISGCSLNKYFDPLWLNSVNFNNRFVEFVDSVSTIVEESFSIYDASIPDKVNEDSKIDTSDMDLYKQEFELLFKEAEDLKKIKSRDEKQQATVLKEFGTYIDSLKIYENKYDDVILYYSSKGFEIDGGKVQTLNDEISSAFDDFALIHEKFVNVVLPAFYKTK